MTIRASPASRLVRFGGLQAANAIAPLVVLPMVIAIVGESGWVAFSIGFSIGSAGAVAVGLAWPLVGPPRVAGVAPRTAATVFRESLAMRLLVLPGVLVVSIALVVALAPPGVDLILPCFMTIAMLMNGLSAAWYFIGRGEPGNILVFETMPRLAGTALSIPVIGITGQPAAYPLILFLCSLLGLLGATRKITCGGPTFGSWKSAFQGIRSQVSLGLAGVLSTGATSLAVPVASISGAAIGQIASFAAVTRLRSMAQGGVSAGTAALQGWVAEDGIDEWRKRAGRALLLNLGLGALAGVGIGITAPVLDSLIFGPETEISGLAAGLLALTVLFYSASASLSNHILAPAGRVRAIVTSTLIASIVAVPLVFCGSRSFGAEGGIAAIAIAEGVVVLLQGVAARSAVKSTSRLVASTQDA